MGARRPSGRSVRYRDAYRDFGAAYMDRQTAVDGGGADAVADEAGKSLGQPDVRVD